jgi:hypothetical protein
MRSVVAVDEERGRRRGERRDAVAVEMGAEAVEVSALAVEVEASAAVA